METSKQRIIHLQKALRIAKDALKKIESGNHHGNTSGIAWEALEKIYPLEKTVSLQGLLGHE